jgi:hypothetical protein
MLGKGIDPRMRIDGVAVPHPQREARGMEVPLELLQLGLYAAGLWMVVLGILSVLFRVLVFLFGSKPPEEVNLQIGHVVTDV